MKNIEQYIQLAINNGYWMFEDWFELEDYLSYHRDIEEQRYQWKGTEDIALIWLYIKEKKIEDFNVWYYPLLQIITSKEFIKSVVNGIKKNIKLKDNIQEWEPFSKWYIDWLTMKQAIAIRDNKLEEFIINLLWKE